MFFLNPCRCCSAAKFIYTGLNRWVHFLRTRGFSLSNCPAELLWYWNCDGEVLVGTQVWPKRLLQISQHSAFVSQQHWLTSKARQNSQHSLYIQKYIRSNRPCAIFRVWRHHLTLSCEYSSQWVGTRVLFKPDASAEKKAGKTPATETNEAFAPSLAISELQTMKAAVLVQTIVPLILWAHKYPDNKSTNAAHSPVSAHTHARTHVNPPGLHERRTLKQSETRKKQRIIGKIRYFKLCFILRAVNYFLYFTTISQIVRTKPTELPMDQFDFPKVWLPAEVKLQSFYCPCTQFW